MVTVFPCLWPYYVVFKLKIAISFCNTSHKIKLTAPFKACSHSVIFIQGHALSLKQKSKRQIREVAHSLCTHTQKYSTVILCELVGSHFLHALHGHPDHDASPSLKCPSVPCPGFQPLGKAFFLSFFPLHEAFRFRLAHLAAVTAVVSDAVITVAPSGVVILDAAPSSSHWPHSSSLFSFLLSKCAKKPQSVVL